MYILFTCIFKNNNILISIYLGHAQSSHRKYLECYKSDFGVYSDSRADSGTDYDSEADADSDSGADFDSNSGDGIGIRIFRFRAPTTSLHGNHLF